MTYQYQSDIRLGLVELNVIDLAKMRDFYRDYIGFHVLSEDDKSVNLTIDGSETVLRFIQADKSQELMYGLYHTAILVPDRDSLGLALRHLVVNQVPLTGGADHGYSEAIYLDDPEGNGIEIYRDKPVSEWDIREDGRIIGVTEEMDAQSMLDNLVNIPDHYRLALGTRVGHVHLSVPNALESSKLYQKVLGLGDKFSIPSASWIASGNYHHHLAFNQWAGPDLSKRTAQAAGLSYLTVFFKDSILFEASQKKAKLFGMQILEEGQNTFMMEDSNGIRTKVILEKE